MKITQGQIWEVVTDGFLTSIDKSSYKRQIKLDKGEKIEIRYPYEWHFRTWDNHYLHAEVEVILANCKLIGTIIPHVKATNKANLEEILRLRLYDQI